MFPVRLAVLGRSPFDGVVLKSIRAFFEPSTNATLESYQISQAATKASCENFNYTVYTTERGIVRFTITMDKTFLRVLTGEKSKCVAYVYVDVFLMDCPPGFSMWQV